MRDHGRLASALVHVLSTGDWRGMRIGDLMASDEGLVELYRMAGDESLTFDDREAATVVVCDPVSVERLTRLRCVSYQRMDAALADQGGSSP